MRTARVVISLIIVLSATIASESMMVDVQNVPIERVVANLERQVDERPKDAGLRVNLARVHAMAYAQKASTVPSTTRRGAAPTNTTHGIRTRSRSPSAG